MGRPYGVYNDWMLEQCKVKKWENGAWNASKRYVANTVAFGTGQSPIYGLYLIASSMIPGILKGVFDLDMDHITDAFRKNQ